jgi:probable rRNA maturation factor
MRFVVLNSSALPVSKKWLLIRAGKIWREILGELPLKTQLVAVNSETVVMNFVDAKEMKRLNKQFRGKDYATDVLSFAPSEPGSLGELVFCSDVLMKQAKDHSLSFEFELSYMIIHGLLHLLGYDHEQSVAEERRMFKLQDKVFARFSEAR